MSRKSPQGGIDNGGLVIRIFPLSNPGTTFRYKDCMVRVPKYIVFVNARRGSQLTDRARPSRACGEALLPGGRRRERRKVTFQAHVALHTFDFAESGKSGYSATRGRLGRKCLQSRILCLPCIAEGAGQANSP